LTVLIIAASKSDVDVMKKAAEMLDKDGTKWKLHVCSAHRTPDMLDRIMGEIDDSCDAIIAGAGLAAALPGVVAAKTTIPVIGVPLAGAFDGLDALLSIIQMPPGIPVITTGVNGIEEAAATVVKIATNKMKRVNITSIKNKNKKAIEKATEALKELRIEYSCTEKIVETAINLCFIGINETTTPKNADAIVIYCPTAEKETAADALKLLQLTKKGAWVGLNRGENAAVAAAEILKKTKELTEYRWKMRIQVEEADKRC